MQANTGMISPDTVIGEVARLKAAGFRFVTMSCTILDDGNVDLLYHFDKDLEMKHLRMTVAKGSTVPSISPVYFAAVLVENEIQDLFGLHFAGLILDYGGTFYLDEEAPHMPFCSVSIRKSGRTAKQAPGRAADDTAPQESVP
jgi:ech hydrogenase subunit D